MMRVPIKRLQPAARVPAYQHGEEDAAVDLCSVEAGTIPAGQGRAFGTGLAFELPTGTVGLVWDRSGLAFKQGVTVLGGMIDSGYRGEVKVYLHNTGAEPVEIKPGDRIAQFLIIKHEHATFEESDALGDSSRGAGGFGSTGH